MTPEERDRIRELAAIYSEVRDLLDWHLARVDQERARLSAPARKALDGARTHVRAVLETLEPLVAAVAAIGAEGERDGR